eukprot:TRINITY_DN2924_c0_g1_i1.p4 TRINITY_DN2924_c0_g1~~TRINITY_DN2924_c0_g1_i1.p4  ORF type:complete len:51 (-),score=5.12 TRINITY_DN2924_c0_g1_i1:150-302(-)
MLTIVLLCLGVICCPNKMRELQDKTGCCPPYWSCWGPLCRDAVLPRWILF